MTAQCNPAKLQILGGDLIEHFQLPQCWISSLPEGVPSTESPFLGSIPAEYAEYNKSKFVRLPRQSFPDLEGSQLKVLGELCTAAHPSEEFFVTVARNQWLRTTIKSVTASVDLFSVTLTTKQRNRNTSIHSNVLPYEPYWRPLAIRDESSSRVHLIPCCILKEEEKALTRKLIEWRQESDSREECDIRKHEQEDGNTAQQRPSKMFWEVLDTNVVTGKVLTAPSQPAQVSLVTWRGGNFIRKTTYIKPEFDAEVTAMQRLCHPHIVYIFGISSFDGSQGSLYMERMESDLLAVIVDKAVRPESGNKSGPPFLLYNSVDILLQIAKAMAHMHKNQIIHGDLKSANVLVSKFGSHYLAKVADFGSAQVKDSEAFKPASGTTNYAAPEVLEFRGNKGKVISVPENIDVYSFGVVAFEVLTGMTMDHLYKNMYPSEVKRLVMTGDSKPPLRAECQKNKFLHRFDNLISLIEACWHGDTSKRPPFPDIVKVLNTVIVQILEPTARSDGPSSPASIVDDNISIAPEVNTTTTSALMLQEAASRDPSPSLDQANNTSVAPQELNLVPASGSSGRLSQPDHLGNNNIVPLHVEGPGRRRRQKRPGKLLKKLRCPFSCMSRCMSWMSGGKVHQD